MPNKGFLGEVEGIFSTLGKDALKVFGFLGRNSQTLAVFAEAADPAAAPAIEAIAAAVGGISKDVVGAEATWAAAGATNSGAAKMANVLPQVEDAISKSIEASGMVIADAKQFKTAVAGFAQNWVDLLKSVETKVESAISPAPAPSTPAAQ